jgi:hypothetical protein
MSTILLMPDYIYKLTTPIIGMFYFWHQNIILKERRVNARSFWALSLRIFCNLFTYYEMSLIILKGGYLWQTQK